MSPSNVSATQTRQPSASVVDKVHSFILEGIDLRSNRLSPASDPFWKGIRDVGTELWLDTGDLEGAEKIWVKEFSALTTNNTLLNTEVQKGIYDEIVKKAAAVLSGADLQTKVVEIAFILNARHGLRLAQRFGGKVSVELHTDLSHDIENAVAYGRRFRKICPEHFIVKVPLTPSGLVATRILRQEGIPVNFTLGFSARHNHVATAFAGPSYVNVFLGRLGAYFADNALGDGKNVGEKATLASQRTVEELSRRAQEPTRQIAASMRGASQIADLAGVDVYTMPLKVAAEGRKSLDGKWRSRRADDPQVALASGVEPRDVRMETLWDISPAERKLSEAYRTERPTSADQVVRMAEDAGSRDLFPRLSKEDQAQIASDGKIPKHDRWRERVRKGELAVDTLLNLAGLASFTQDQAALDDRIRRLIG